MGENWETIAPQVDSKAEFLEIAGDFGDPFEIFREAISNAFDAEAKVLEIDIRVEKVNGYPKLMIVFEDDGNGMTYEQLKGNFWDLGNSYSRQFSDRIGEKGHGTKIYLRSDKIKIETSDGTSSFESICESPFASLTNRKMHSPMIRRASREKKGTKIEIEGYNNNERSRYLFPIVRDYILWKTKLGSFENQFDGKPTPEFKVKLRCIGDVHFTTLSFGHVFAEENHDINSLYKQYDLSAADYYVKKFVQTGKLDKRPETEYEAVIYFEGLHAKQQYNDMLRGKKSNEKGYYKVSDRYGIWLSKDYIPVERVNDWIANFGGGAGSVGLLHGFVNCQDLKLTANRGSIANTDPEIVEEVKKVVLGIIDKINTDMYKNNIETLQKWQREEKTMDLERAEFEKRKRNVISRRKATILSKQFLEPTNESELFGLFIALYYMKPDLFDFEPLDYNTNQGIDLLARNLSDQGISDSDYWYVELKYVLSDNFNHSFKNIRRILCWEISKSIKDGTLLTSVVEEERREFKIAGVGKDRTYFLDNDNNDIKIRVISIKELLKAAFDVEFV